MRAKAVLLTSVLSLASVGPSLHAGLQRVAPASSRAEFLRVFSAETPGLTLPVATRLGRMSAAQALAEAAGRVELEITVGADGLVRDAMVKTSRGGTRVEADAVRAAANSYFDPGTLNGQPVPVRIPLSLSVPDR